jgi:hypothetical protein
MLKNSHGNYTPTQVDRCAKICGPLYKELDILLSASGLGITHYTHDKKELRHTKDVAKFIADFKEDQLLDFIPGRFHKGFEHFMNTKRMRAPHRLGNKLHSLSAEMDMWRDLVN